MNAANIRLCFSYRYTHSTKDTTPGHHLYETRSGTEVMVIQLPDDVDPDFYVMFPDGMIGWAHSSELEPLNKV